MKTYISILFLVALFSLESCKNCGRGPKERSTKYFTETGFTEVQAGGSFNVKIRQGDSYEIQITTEDRIMSHVDTKTRGDKLILELDGRRFRNCDANIDVIVTMPTISGISASGGSYFYTDGEINGSTLNVDASGGSQVDMAVRYATVKVNASGGSKVDLGGGCDHLDIDMSGGTNLELYDLYTGNASVSGSGGSRAEIQVSNELDVNLSGGSKVLYKGTGVLSSVETSGGSSVEHIN